MSEPVFLSLVWKRKSKYISDDCGSGSYLKSGSVYRFALCHSRRDWAENGLSKDKFWEGFSVFSFFLNC